MVFHDVDHLPENDQNCYGGGEIPRHFAAKLDKYKYILSYKEFFGVINEQIFHQFKMINVFPMPSGNGDEKMTFGTKLLWWI